MIYDPISSQVIINEVEQSNKRPLQHPVIRLIRALADLQQKVNFGNQYLATGNLIIKFKLAYFRI